MRSMLMILLVMLLAAGVQEARAAASRPTEAVPMASCVSADCHGDVKSHRVLHGPVNVNACDSCHTLTDAASHSFKLAREGKELCTFCHDITTDDAPVVHRPVLDGECSSCHNPHGGKSRAMTRGANIREACLSCHKDADEGMKFVHGPSAAGACDSCHLSHKSNFRKLLTIEGNELCFDCHRDMRRQLAQANVVHKPVEGNCLDCHDPHSSNFTMQTKAAPADLCLSCHQADMKTALAGKHKHSVVTNDQACINCHTSHGSQLADLMKDEPINICMQCHSKPQQAPDGRKVAGVPEVNDPKLIKHGPIRDGNCSGCHSTHGSDVQFLLAKTYPAAFYQQYADEKYELCFSCHDRQLVQTAEARGLTNFRNGEQNLHYLHVNREKGRNCRSCHSTHASPNELHVRESVPFGKWQMPIGYQKTQTGGSCAPGCHEPYEYDRDTPRVYNTAAAEKEL